MYSSHGPISGIRSWDSPPKTSPTVRLRNLSELQVSRVQTSVAVFPVTAAPERLPGGTLCSDQAPDGARSRCPRPVP
jgi:hypothetical protein